MTESEELKTAHTEYLAKITKYGALPMPATAHYTAGYKDGCAILLAVAQTCAEAEKRFEELTRQRDLAVSALESVKLKTVSLADAQVVALEALAAIKESEA